MDAMESLRPHLMPNINGESLKSFVDAEKNLISNMMKPNGEKPAHKAAHAAKRPARRRGTKAAQAAQAAV